MSSLSPYQPDGPDGQRRLELYRQLAQEQLARTSGFEARRAAYAAKVQMETIWALTDMKQAITDSTGGTAGFTLYDVTASHSQSILNNNFASINRQLDAFRTALVATGVIKGAA